MAPSSVGLLRGRRLSEEIQVPSVHSLQSVDIAAPRGANQGEEMGERRKPHSKKCGKSATIVKGHGGYREGGGSHLPGALF